MRALITKYGFLFCLALAITGCSRNEATFLVETYVEMMVPAGSPADRILILEKEVIFPYSAELRLNNVAEADVQSVHGAFGLVYSKFNAINDLSFINEIEVDVVDPASPNSSGKEIFYYTQRDLGRRSEIELLASLPDVKELIIDDRLFLRIEVSFNTPPPSTFTLAYELSLGVFEED